MKFSDLYFVLLDLYFSDYIFILNLSFTELLETTQNRVNAISIGKKSSDQSTLCLT